VALTMAIIWALPKLTKGVPAPLAASDRRGLVIGPRPRRAARGRPRQRSGGLPELPHPDGAADLETLEIILPYALILAAIGLIESLLTLNLVGEMTGKRGGASQECVAQGAPTRSPASSAAWAAAP
jgi:SulP family sulfate permease